MVTMFVDTISLPSLLTSQIIIKLGGNALIIKRGYFPHASYFHFSQIK